MLPKNRRSRRLRQSPRRDRNSTQATLLCASNASDSIRRVILNFYQHGLRRWTWSKIDFNRLKFDGDRSFPREDYLD